MRPSSTCETTGQHGVTLIEMLVAMVVSSLVLASAGSLLTNALLGYRNAQNLGEAAMAQSSADAVLQTLILGASLNKNARKPFNDTPSVDATGKIVAARAFAYDRFENDIGIRPSPGCPPMINPPAPNNPREYTGIIYWYRDGPGAPYLDGSGTYESTQFAESTLYWAEAQKGSIKFKNVGSTFTSLDSAGVLKFQDDRENRLGSRVLGVRVAAFAVDYVNEDSSSGDISYRLEFQLPMQ